MAMEKRGDLTSQSQSDFDTRQKVKYADADGPYVASERDKHLLKTPTQLSFDAPQRTPGYNWPIIK